MSATYAQSSHADEQKIAMDPDNRLLSRMPRRRLSIEAYRDAVLSVAGRLDSTVGGTSIQPDRPEEGRRTLYSQISRMTLNPMLSRFDFPDPNAHSALRFETTTPLQKLFLLNSEFMVYQSNWLAQRLREYGGSSQSKIDYAYKLLYARPPTATELALAEDFLTQDKSTRDGQKEAAFGLNTRKPC